MVGQTFTFFIKKNNFGSGALYDEILLVTNGKGFLLLFKVSARGSNPARPYLIPFIALRGKANLYMT